MIGFAEIAGGMPSAASGMTNHLMTQTLTPDQAKLAIYYSRGMVAPGIDRLMQGVVQAVADGDIEFKEGVDLLMERWERRNPPPGPAEAWEHDHPLMTWSKDHWEWSGPSAQEVWEQRRDDAEMRLGDRLDVLVDRTVSGLDNAPLAVIRPDAHPSALAGLGIEADGLLSREEINALLVGRRADGEKIDGKHYAVERALPVNPKTGEDRRSIPIGSYDFSPTPDKTVSVAWAFAGPVEQAKLYNAHIEAAREAVAYIAQEVGVARLGDGGKDGAVPGHVLWLEFTHHTARRVQVKKDGIVSDLGPGDPNLHTHFLMPNAVFVPATATEPARVGSLDTAAIGGFIKEATQFYHARLSQKLRNAGFDSHLDEKTGAARLSIIPENIRALFSKRTNEGVALAQEMAAAAGVDWDTLSVKQRQAWEKNATQSYTQKQKGGKDDIADVQSWIKQAQDAGWRAPKSMEFIGPPLPPLTHEQRIRQAYEIALPFLAERLEQNSVLKHYDVRVAAMRGLVETGNVGLADADAVTRMMWKEGVVQNGEKTQLVFGEEDGKRFTWITTRMHQSDERQFISLMKAAAADKSGAIPPRLLKEKIRQSGLEFTDGHGRAQLNAMVRVAHGGRFGLIVGAAGMGKTESMKPIVAAWRDQGRDVWGTSLAWRQADDLEQPKTHWSDGLEKRNLKAFSVFLDGLNSGDIVLGKNSRLILDEYGMIGTRQGLDLLRHQATMGFSIIALGDDKQCASPMAGPIIDLSRRALGPRNVPEILTTRRQKAEREREIVGLLREGRAAEALAMKREDGTAELVYGGREAVIERTAKLYAERLAATGEAPGINAPTNRDAHDISAAVRLERRGMGLIGPNLTTLKATDGKRQYDMPIAIGDRVRLHVSTVATYSTGRGGPIGRNGSVLEVVDISGKGLTLKNAKGTVGMVKWSNLDKGGRVFLSYGDATTIHTAQGSSRGEQITAYPDGTGVVIGQISYSALTRHFHRSHMLTNEQAERLSVQRSRPLNDQRDITTADKWANVAKSFANMPEKDSAIALAERVRVLRTGGVKQFHQVLQPGPASQAPAVVQRQHLGQSIARYVQSLRPAQRHTPAVRHTPGPRVRI